MLDQQVHYLIKHANEIRKHIYSASKTAAMCRPAAHGWNKSGALAAPIPFPGAKNW